MKKTIAAERVIQDKALEYVKASGIDDIKESGIAYSGFLHGCLFMLANRDEILKDAGVDVNEKFTLDKYLTTLLRESPKIQPGERYVIQKIKGMITLGPRDK